MSENSKHPDQGKQTICSLKGNCVSHAEPRYIAEFEEALDLLTDILVKDGLCIAIFKFGPVALPLELEPRLRELVGRKAAVLRIDGYHVRAV